MKEWLETLITEKGFDLDHELEVDVGGIFGTNFIPLAVLVEAIDGAPENEKKEIKKTLVMIDFKNGDIMHFFNHLAKAIAI